MIKLGFFSDTTHQQIDDSFRDRIQRISEKFSASINQVITVTQGQQSTLLDDANASIATIEEKYKTQLQRHVEELDKVKAQNLNSVQKDLHLRNAIIFEQARKSINDLHEEANRLKMSILQGTQGQVNAIVEEITEQVTA